MNPQTDFPLVPLTSVPLLVFLGFVANIVSIKRSFNIREYLSILSFVEYLLFNVISAVFRGHIRVTAPIVLITSLLLISKTSTSLSDVKLVLVPLFLTTWTTWSLNVLILLILMVYSSKVSEGTLEQYLLAVRSSAKRTVSVLLSITHETICLDSLAVPVITVEITWLSFLTLVSIRLPL